MRKIDKGEECEQLRAWKDKNPKGKYEDLDHETRRAVRQSLLDEQYYLCAYCCNKLTGLDDCHNEHILPQSSQSKAAQQATLLHTNLVASCNLPRQCGDEHGKQELPLTPLMAECETELRFKWSGRVEGLSERARESIKVLNLGDNEVHNKALIERRKRLCEDLLLVRYGPGGPESWSVEEVGVLQMLLEELSCPSDGRLEAYAPVLCNILRAELNGRGA